MNAIEDARAALAMLDEHPWIDDTTASWLKIMRREAKATRDALRALISEHERIRAIAGDGLNEMARERDEARAEVARLTAPPTDDEREALIEQATWTLIEWDTDTADRGVRDEHYRERRADIERIFPILHRRQGPITDAMIQRAREASAAQFGYYPTIEEATVILEAARDAS